MSSRHMRPVGKGDGPATLNGRTDGDLPLDLLASEKRSPLATSAAANNGQANNKLLNYRQRAARSNSPPLLPPPPLIDDQDDERLLAPDCDQKWENKPTGSKQQSRGDIDIGRSGLVRANSLNTNSTGEQSKCDDEDDNESGRCDAEDRQNDDDDEKRRFLDEANESESSLGQEAQGEERKSFIRSNDRGDAKKNKNKNKKLADLARQESIFDQEQEAGALSSSGEGASEKNKKQQSDSKKKKNKKSSSEKERKRRQEPDDEDEPPAGRRQSKARDPSSSCCRCSCSCWTRMFQILRARKWLVIPILLLVTYSVAIYCLPFLTQLEPKVPDQLPVIPFDFNRGPLKPSTASAFKAERLFRDQLHGPESLAFDSQGNCYMAVEGGFVLYAHLNKSSPIKRTYLDSAPPGLLPLAGLGHDHSLLQRQHEQQQLPDLIKIADLNGWRQVVGQRTARPQRDSSGPVGARSSGWQRECQHDERVYGPQLYEQVQLEPLRPKNFKSKVRVSRCSKPLGLRLSRDESSLYVIDTLSGLYRVNLRAADKPHSMSQRQVTKLIDFRVNEGRQVLPAIQLEDEPEQVGHETGGALQATRLMNVSLKAMDDLVIDSGRGYDLIYMTCASQQWPATSFIYDALEGRPSGLVLRYDTSTSLLAVLEPTRLAHVRTSAIVEDEQARERFNKSLLIGRSGPWPSIMMGAPRLDENDVFDDRQLNFPNGIELTDEGRALLIADTLNKRIIRHYVRGSRRGTSDLWAWTPMFPDNIRRGTRGGQGQRETYWVVGCGKSPTSFEARALPAALATGDVFSLLRTWPRVRKFLLKNLYFIGSLVESMGAKVLRSNKVEDAGYELRTGSSLVSSGCVGMMIIQYNQFGDIIRSVHSREFPNDLYYYSQVNELIDPDTGEHSLYLGSPSYNYLTKLILPPGAESQVPPASSSGPPNGMSGNDPSETIPQTMPPL